MKKFLLWGCLLLVFSCNCDQGEKGKSETSVKVEATKQDNQNASSAIGNASGGTGGGFGAYQKSPEQVMIQEGREGNATEEEINEKMQNRFKMKKEDNVPVATHRGLPPSCSFLPDRFINQYFGLAPGTIKIKDASAANQPQVKSCFFRWDNGMLPNSGIFLQIQGNPYPEEITLYASSFIDGKLEKGEQAMGEVMTHYPYEKFPVADGGAYSAEQGKFFWRVGDAHVFMLAFNLGMDKKSELKYAQDLSKEIMKNYNRIMSSN